MYQCARCGHISDRKFNINKHINKKKTCKPILKDIKSNYIKLKCDKCKRDFININSLETHNCEIDPKCKEKIVKIVKMLNDDAIDVDIVLNFMNDLEKYKELIKPTKRNYDDDIDKKHYNELILTRKRKNFNSRVRSDARKKFSETKINKKCFICEHSENIHICHIKDVKDFSDEISLEVINSLNNIIALCPNCHTSFDRNKDGEIGLRIKNEYIPSINKFFM